MQARFCPNCATAMVSNECKQCNIKAIGNDYSFVFTDYNVTAPIVSSVEVTFWQKLLKWLRRA